MRSVRQERRFKEREEQILSFARDLVEREGPMALSMDKLAALVEWSKGTIYQHFASKEDVLAALCLKAQQRMSDLFARAVLFRGRPRERILAVGVAEDLLVRMAPHSFRTDQILLLHAKEAKIEGDRLQALTDQETRCFDLVCGVVRDGVAQGDLVVPPQQSPESITMALWSLSFGAHFIGDVLGSFARIGYSGRVFDAIVQGASAYLDGLGWKPLTADQDWRALERRVREEVFPAESKALGDF